MPYAFVEQDGVLRVTLQGIVSGAELHEMITELEQQFQVRPVWPNNLFDLRGVELSPFGFSDMMGVAKRREATMPPHPIRTALVTDSAAMLGFARMFQNLNQNPSIAIEVFHSMAEAEAFVAKQP